MFIMMIWEGVVMYVFNGELFVQVIWDISLLWFFWIQFWMVSLKCISNLNNIGDSWNCCVGVQINDSGVVLGYYVSEDGYFGWMLQKWIWIFCELFGGCVLFIYVFEFVEDGQICGVNVFYSVMEQMKMFDMLQNMQLQSVIVKVMYVVIIESELDMQLVMDFILGVNSQEQWERLIGWIGEIVVYYVVVLVWLGGVKVLYLMLGDLLNLQMVQDMDNGYFVFEQLLLWYIVVGLGVLYEQFFWNYVQMSYFMVWVSVNELWAYFMGW